MDTSTARTHRLILV